MPEPALERAPAGPGRRTAAAYRAAIALLLAGMGIAMFLSARSESQTFDEAIYLTSGYLHWRAGDYSMTPEHPPLSKLVAALPLLWLDPRIPYEHESWRLRNHLQFSAVFLYRNRVAADTILTAARLPMMALTLVLGVLLAVWTWRKFGPAAALGTAFLYALDPNLTAHGRYAATDLVVTLAVFLAVAGWARYLETLRARDLAGAGAALGLAFASKSSALFLPAFLLLLAAIRWRQSPHRYSLRRLAGALALACVLGGCVLAATYGPANWAALTGRYGTLGPQLDRETVAGRLLAWAGETLRIPAHPYLAGLDSVASHIRRGHRSYLLGQVSERGWWWYFPVVIAVKTPTAVLALLAAAALWALRRLARRNWAARLRQAPFPAFVVALTPAMFLLPAMASGLNIGLRYLLPMYPFLLAAAGWAMTRRRALALLPLIAGFQVYEYARVAPHYLAFFNAPAGGPENGAAYLLDSNIDWGQDLKRLGEYLRREGIPEVCLVYFGTADPAHYGVRRVDPARCSLVRQPAKLDRVVAISLTLLEDVYGGNEDYAWLRRHRPTAVAGRSIYVYDLRRREK